MESAGTRSSGPGTWRMAKYWKRFYPFLVLVGLWALFFWRFAAPGADRITYPAGDFSQQFGVFRDLAYRSLIGGRLPLWTECLWSGYPFHADPQAQVFYPPIWLLFGVLRLQGWGNFPLGALVAEVAAHYLLLSFFVYFFLRSIGCRRAPAVLGSVVFTYGGYLMGSPPLQTATLEVDTWLPLALLFAGQLAQSRRWRYLALTALMLALSYLAGHPQTFLYVALLVMAYFAFRAAQARWKFGAFAGVAAALVGLTTALAAVQLLPSLQFILNSTRASVAFDQAGHGFPFEDIVQFFLTGFVSYWHPLYVGILPLGLAVFALTRRMAEVRFWAATAVTSLILSFGTKAAAYDVVYWIVPGYRLFRGQEHVALVVSFSLAVLAALGAQALLGALSRGGRKQLQALTWAGGVGLAVAFGLLMGVQYLSQMGLDRSSWGKLPDRVGVMTLAFGLAFVALAVRGRVPALRRWAPALFIGVAVIDLFSANRPLNVVPDFQAFPYNPLLEPITAEPGFFRVRDEFQLAGHAGCVYGYWGVESPTPYRVATYDAFLERAPESPRWRLLGVRFMVTWRQGVSHLSDLLPAEVSSAPAAPGVPNQAGLTKVFRFTGYDPRRAFLTHAVQVVSDATVYEAMAAPDFDPFYNVLLPQTAIVGPEASGDVVAILRDVPGQLRLRTTAVDAAVLVFSEAYFPAWRVTVDGRPAPLLRADGALLAVALPAGTHEVEFIYLPPLLVWGGIISLLAAMACAVVIVKK
jgi:hypothetical protein